MAHYVISYDVSKQFQFIRGADGHFRHRRPLMNYFYGKINNLFRKTLEEGEMVGKSVYRVDGFTKKEFDNVATNWKSILTFWIEGELTKARLKHNAEKVRFYKQRFDFIQKTKIYVRVWASEVVAS